MPAQFPRSFAGIGCYFLIREARQSSPRTSRGANSRGWCCEDKFGSNKTGIRESIVGAKVQFLDDSEGGGSDE
jgi:hypothetical protein